MDFLKELHSYKQQKVPVALVTITKIVGSAPCILGAKMIVDSQGNIKGTIGGGRFEYQVIKDAIQVLKTNKIQQFTYTLGAKFAQCCGGQVDLIIEPMFQKPKLLIFGAGHVGHALADILKDTPFELHLIDNRPHWFEALETNEDIQVHNISDDEYTSLLDQYPQSYIVVMTHQHDLDFDIIKNAINKTHPYVGLIASNTKKKRFEMRLAQKDIQGFEKVHAPIGLPLGGHTPQEIAISISGQLLNQHYSS